MIVFFVLGLVLFVVAGWAVAAQSVMYGLSARSALFVSAFELWYTLAPGSLVLTQIRLEAVAPWLWDPVARSLLFVPAWALSGGPGAALVWFFRPRHLIQAGEQGEADRLDESVRLYDDLVKAAREEGFRDHGPDPHRGPGALTDEEARAIIDGEQAASAASGTPTPRREERHS